MAERPATDGIIAPLTPREGALATRLTQHVQALASQIGERHVGRAGSLPTAAKYIVTTLQAAGCDVVGHGYQVTGVDVHNIVSEQRGETHPGEVVLIGAHYDTVPDCPGANDNASGIAALLELATACRAQRFQRTLRFVAFVNEEAPFFHTEAMGSLLYARRCRADDTNIIGMCALETIGYYTSAAGSQRYPATPFSWFYPSTADFIAFVSNVRSRAWLRQAASAFRAASTFPLVTAAVPPLVPGASASDHWSFWQVGYPALMVTDTAPFRYEHYHTPSDVPRHLDYNSMSRVVMGLLGMLERLALHSLASTAELPPTN